MRRSGRVAKARGAGSRSHAVAVWNKLGEVLVLLKVVGVIGLALVLSTSPASAEPAERGPASRTWTADNGDGTFTNPLFYDEFSDPDMIRVGDDFYLTGTTMHAMPGLPILRSRDLVNWRFVAYASDKLDLGPQFRLEDGREIYGQGIWAPSFRHHDGVFYIFSNVNGQTTQVFRATSPAGPWTRTPMKVSLHDLSVLFDDDGKVYVVWGYDEVLFAQLNDQLTDIVPGTQRIIIPKGSGMGEGSHFYKIDGRYYITSAVWDGPMRLAAARADRPEGPYEVNRAVSIDEDFGLAQGNRLEGDRIRPGDPESRGRHSLHQGGVIRTPAGEWWGYSMMDYNAVGRLTALSPVTWKDGWPYFGLPGNLGRTPRAWVKPKTAKVEPISAPYERDDDFSAPTLKPIWQWNHVPVDDKWSLAERPGFLRLKTQPAKSFWEARNTLTQRAIGPRSSPVVKLDPSGLRPGDVAGLALLNKPYAWIGVERDGDGLSLVQFNAYTGDRARVPIPVGPIWHADFLAEKSQFSYSADGEHFTPLGGPFDMVFQLKTFQGVRYSLFAYNQAGQAGGHADFDSIRVREPDPHGLMRPIPYGQAVRLTGFGAATGLGVEAGRLQAGPPTPFTVVDMKLGRVALKSGGAYLAVDPSGGVSLSDGRPGAGQSFQWIETPTGELVLMSLATHRFLRIDPATGKVFADSPGPAPDGRDGVRFLWSTGASKSRPAK
ncbi:Beta-xylosidase [Caulobacter sp. UNC279MFTsu5.1]|nr:Beta-xylosidase [Caulobacter sp. UNC279MFTsu5.1]